MNYVIEVNKLSKIYRIYNNPKDRLKEALSFFRKRKYHREFYALKTVSFKVKMGGTLGIIGKNGAGKSTLLKLLTGIITPSSGTISVRGKISALLELGAGFNLEYTGIENIYLQGLLMGFSKFEMDQKLEQILEFADIGEFINQPVKTYSSGMFVRLAFATAINVEPDILIVDEALAVGDVFFQNKCYRKFAELQELGVTILFVSHDIGSVKQFCDEVIWINNGEIEAIGDKETVCAKYLSWEFSERNKEIIIPQEMDKTIYKDVKEKNSEVKSYPRLNTKNIEISGTEEAEILSFTIHDELGNDTLTLETTKDYTFIIIAKFNEALQNIIFGFVLENIKGLHVFTTNSYLNENVIREVKKGEIYKGEFRFTLPKFSRGTYFVSPAVAVGSQNEHKTICWYHNVVRIDIINPGFNLALIEFPNEVTITKVDEENLLLI